MGYPRVPLANATPMVAHKGEINGEITTTAGNLLIFSAKTEPGNSGAPLLDLAGLVVGVITEDLRRTTDTRTANLHLSQPYFAAIPSSEIADFVREIVRSDSKPNA